MPTRCNRWFFIGKLVVCSTCFGHHYAHHQDLKSIIQVAAACGTWCFGFQVVGLTWSCGLCVRFAGCCSKAPSTTSNSHLYNTLELIMMGIMVPEICWANNKFSNKEPSAASSWQFISTYDFKLVQGQIPQTVHFSKILLLMVPTRSKFQLLCYKICINNEWLCPHSLLFKGCWRVFPGTKVPKVWSWPLASNQCTARAAIYSLYCMPS